jgi:molecular chaperone GrpE
VDAPEPEPERAGSSPPTVTADEVERLRRELDDQRHQQLRLLADFENFRRRVGREQETARREGARNALLPLLSVLDTLERALGAGSIDPDFYEGVAATHRLFINALREAGADPVASVGRPFDPQVQEAVATVVPDGTPPGTVVREVRRGWRLRDEMLRPAQVVVAKFPEADGPWP